jgi:hypothetical protein
MRTVFVVQHSYSLGSCEEIKLIGIYSTRRRAQAAVTRLRRQPGFRKRPDDFCIESYALDLDHWAEGFVTIPAQASRGKSRRALQRGR